MRLSLKILPSRYGKNEYNLHAWLKLCRNLGVSKGRSINECKKYLTGIFNNIVDFVQAMGSGDKVHAPFESARALRDNIHRTSKLFRFMFTEDNPLLEEL
ncbi:hypothetical protein M433DRAFT_102876 [Acidomyces richmondensis BFW]|nr:MAG: hypothetical protein FE78DRAFT_158964 [Acidomyces sp. 'richmondensis']KYG48306.1 hypothetical protein M433DRAFT_102876 [Acidomyces richmondensis BFW]